MNSHMKKKKISPSPVSIRPYQQFQRDISKLGEWEMEWKVKFNVDKVVYAVGIIYIPNKLKICYLNIKKKKKARLFLVPKRSTATKISRY